MRRRWIVAGLMLAGAGCNRQDAECLGRIGTLVGQRLEKLKPPPAAGPDTGLGRALPSYGGPAETGDAEQANK
jgi:hypothetical protein